MTLDRNNSVIFLDIDGTLTVRGNIVPDENKAAIDFVRSLGNKVFINTGRSKGNLPDFILDQVNVDGVICGNGTLVYMNNMPIFDNTFDKKVVKSVAEFVTASEKYWCVYEGVNCCYSAPGNPSQLMEAWGISKIAEDIDKLYEFDRIQVIAVGSKPENDFIEKFSDVLDIYQLDHFADCTPKGYNKTVGAARVLDMLGINKKNTVAIGDSANDLAMIKFAGIGVAMANSDKVILDAADYITQSNNQAGVAKALFYLFNKDE
ncbi:MAG: Cof-type HAD-IIB family hydrolase [Clostridiales bacterium]|nr:Cof-type HAD-IIB family hydrolase [Clostridiales bacterium]